MVRGQYIAATGMAHQRRQMENITNNITNVETHGFKKNFLVTHSFNDVLIQRINDPANQTGNNEVGPLGFGALTDEVYIQYDSGNLEETGIATDFAIIGDSSFFVLDTAVGERYSKAGAFIRNRDGYLTDGSGNYVRGEYGNIFVGDSEFAVDVLGNVLVNGEQVNKLQIVSFDDLHGLRKQGDNL